MSERLVIGCMTGTSIDGIDAALVRINGIGLAMRAEFVRGVSLDFAEPLKTDLRAIANQEPVTASDIATANDALTRLHAAAVEQLDAGPVELVCCHGQTVYHAPPLSWQMFSPSLLATLTSTPVVCDLRQADLAVGGQGAPITPIADWVLFRDEAERRAVVNLGGFCNITLLPAGGSAGPDGVRGMDVCACNQLLDVIARRVMDVAFDAGGEQALAAEPDHDATDDLIGVLAAQGAGRRSLGTGDEATAWVTRHWRHGLGLSGGVLAASACEAIGHAIGQATRECDRIVLAGGGVRNAALKRAIAGNALCPVMTTADVAAKVPIEFREAVCFGVLGALCADRVPITLQQVTGASRAVISGVWAGR